MENNELKNQIELMQKQIEVCEAEKVNSKHIDKLRVKLGKLMQKVVND